MSNVTTEEREREREKKNEKRREERTRKISNFFFLPYRKYCLKMEAEVQRLQFKEPRKFNLVFRPANCSSYASFTQLDRSTFRNTLLRLFILHQRCPAFNNNSKHKRQDYRNFCIYSRSLKGQCREDFAALDQFWAKIITLRLYSLTKCFCKVTTKISNEFYHRGLTIIKFLRIF